MRPKLIPMSPMVIVRRSIFRKDVLDAVHTIVDASETIADNWNKERYMDISRAVVEYVDRRVGRQAATCPGAGRRGKRRRKSVVPALTREKILAFLMIVTRSGIEAVQDYQGGDYPGLAKDVIELAHRIGEAQKADARRRMPDTSPENKNG